MTSAALRRAVAEFDGPTGIPPRGTVIVLTGRGEPPTIYGRLGTRLAVDAYRVRVVETRLDDLAATRGDVAALLDDGELEAPKVLLGSDAGATYAARLAHELDVDGVILAGIALASAGAATTTWDGELEARTACPTHRGVLSGNAAFARGRLGDALPAPLASAPTPPTVPTLLLHGEADSVTPSGAALGALSDAPQLRTAIVGDGRHDILNDVTHRSVAATIVLFLEQLRLGPELPPIVRAAGS